MKLIHKRKTDNKSYAFMIIIVTAFLIFCLTQPLYTDIDNYVISAFVNGLYGADHYCYYLNAVLCKFIELLSFLLPKADNMIFIFRTVVFAGFCVLLCLFFQADTPIHKKISQTLCLWLLSIYSLAANFTVVAAYSCMIGTILIGYSIKKNHQTGYGIWGILFFMMGAMIRLNVGELFIPFVFLNIFILVLSDRACLRRALFCGMMFLLCAGIVTGIDFSVKRSDTYREYLRYNHARSDILDYPVKEYDQIVEQLEKAGVSENEYECLRGYIQFDTDVWTASRLETVADIVKTGNAYRDRSVTAFFKDAGNGLIQNRWIFIQFVGLTFLCILMLNRQDKFYKLGSALVWVGSVLIILYFNYIGRCPMRIYQAVLYGAWGCIWTWKALDHNEQLSDKLQNYSPYLRNILLIFAVIVLMSDFEYVFPQNVFTANGAEDKYESIEGEDQNIYIWNVSEYNTYMCQYFADKGKLPTIDFLRHNFPAGGWRYGQKCYYDFLKDNEIENLMDKLINDTGVFVVGDLWIAETVNNHIHEYWKAEGNLEMKNKIDDKSIWRYNQNPVKAKVLALTGF